jgi:hypothetical protein
MRLNNSNCMLMLYLMHSRYRKLTRTSYKKRMHSRYKKRFYQQLSAAIPAPHTTMLNPKACSSGSIDECMACPVPVKTGPSTYYSDRA